MEDINTTTTATEAPAEATTETSSNSFLETLPEAYRDKPYLQNVNDMDTLLKNFENSQQLIGKKKELNLPNDKSTPEEWNKYYEAIGRPANAEEYKLEYPEELSDIINKEALEQFKKVAYEQGISEKQAQSILKYETELYQGLLEKHNQEQANSEKQFQELATKVLGAEKEKVLETGENLVKKYLPEEMTEHFAQLDNNSKVLMASVLNGIKKDYISEETLTNVSKGENYSTAEDKLARARELMQSKAYRDIKDLNHESTRKLVDGIYKELYSN